MFPFHQHNKIIFWGHTMCNLRVIIMAILIIMPGLFIIPSLEEQGENFKDLTKPVLETNNLEPNEDDGVNTRAEARSSQDDARGGEWIDSFENDSGIEWGLSDHLKLTDGDALINGTYGLDPSAVGIWHFDEGSGTLVHDETPNCNNGTLGGDGNGTDIPVWTQGVFNSALGFDGVDDYVAIPDNSSLRLREAFTLHVWVRPMAVSSSLWQTILEKGSDSYGLYLTDSLTFEVYNAGLSPVSIQTPMVTLGNWYQLVATYDKYNGSRNLYLDSQLVNNSSHSNNISNSVGRALGINKHPGNGDSFFNGTIDEVMIFNRALSAIEIKDLYENGSHYRKIRQANVTSSAIDIPLGMHWDTLMINKTEYAKTYLNITVLDTSNNQPIPGTSTYTENGEIDISFIDPVLYPSIKLNATFEGDGSTSPELHYWAVSWNRSNTWSDTLFGGVKVESAENLEIVDGRVEMASRINSSAVAAWHFDEGTGLTVYDETKNDNDGTITGAVWTNGKYGKALIFDGIDDYVKVNNIVFNPNTDFTLNAWVKISSYTNQEYTILSTAGDSYQEGFALHFDYWNPGKLTVICNGQWKTMSTSSVPFDQWTHVAFVVKSGVGTYYINGLNAGTTAFDSIISNDQLFEIGADSGGSLEMDYFKGMIDEVIIYNQALTSFDIKSIYANGEYPQNSQGTLTSKPITLTTNMCWDSIIVNKTEPEDSSTLNITIFDDFSNQPISSFMNVTGTEIDISSINPIIHNAIKLQALFGSTGENTSILYDWSVNWTANNPPKFIDITSPSSINRTKSAWICINVTDHEESEKNLTVKVEYKSPSDPEWQTSCISTTCYSTDHWNCTFATSRFNEVGSYSFRVTVNDSFQYVNSTIHPDLIEVINNKPTQPDVYIYPVKPKTTDDLIVFAENSTDIDFGGEQLRSPNYWYRWYKNGLHQIEFDNITKILNTETYWDEHWRCVVYPFDGEDVGVPGEAEVVIQNLPPQIGEIFDSYEMYEDMPVILEKKLFDMFIDLDYDNLIFTAMGQEHLQVEITQENGTIKLTPDINWFGTEYITFFANDSSPIEAKQTVEIIVHPTNDLPKIIQIGDNIISEDSSDLGYEIYQNELFQIKIVVDDPDGDVERGMIKYIFNKTKSNNFYFQNSEKKLIFQPNNVDVGMHYIKISITDNNETPAVYIYHNIWINVLNVNDPPSVTITAPQSGSEFLVTDNITFTCTAEDPDLLIPTEHEIFSYQWTTNKTLPDEVGTQREIMVPDHILPPGYYTITVMVEDAAGEKANDSVEIVIKDIPGKKVNETPNGKRSNLSDYLWLWVAIVIIIIIVICLLFLFLFKRKSKTLEALGVTEKPVLTPEGAYKIEVSMATLAQASTASQAGQLGQPLQPQMLDSGPTTSTSSDLVLPPETSLVATPTIPSIAQPPMLPPHSEPTVVKPEPITDSETPLETVTPTVEPTTTEKLQLEIPPETELIQEPIMPEPITDLPPEAYIQPEQPQSEEVEEQAPQQEPIVEVPQPTLTTQEPTLATQQPTLTAQQPISTPQTSHPTPDSATTQPLMTQCPLCQQQIQEYSNPCPHCGGELEWG